MKSTIFSVIIFIIILSIAVSYQLYLMGIANDFNNFAAEIKDSITSQNLNDAENTLSSLKNLWEKNSALLMVFHDHTTINNASVYVKLAEKSFEAKQYEDVISYLIHFTSLINELSAENRPTIENIF